MAQSQEAKQLKVVRKTRFSLGASLAVDRARRGLRVVSQDEIDQLERAGKWVHDAKAALGHTLLDSMNPTKQAELDAYLRKHPLAAKGGAR